MLEILRKAPRHMCSWILVGTEMYCFNKDTIMRFFQISVISCTVITLGGYIIFPTGLLVLKAPLKFCFGNYFQAYVKLFPSSSIAEILISHSALRLVSKVLSVLGIPLRLALKSAPKKETHSSVGQRDCPEDQGARFCR